jgi:hypothetical protein
MDDRQPTREPSLVDGLVAWLVVGMFMCGLASLLILLWAWATNQTLDLSGQ